MNYQNELLKMKPAQLKLLLDAVKLAGLARCNGSDWRRIFIRAKSETISPRVKSLLQAFADTTDIDAAIDAFMEVMPK